VQEPVLQPCALDHDMVGKLEATLEGPLGDALVGLTANPRPISLPPTGVHWNATAYERARVSWIVKMKASGPLANSSEPHI
jgi:hypothetical protein